MEETLVTHYLTGLREEAGFFTAEFIVETEKRSASPDGFRIMSCYQEVLRLQIYPPPRSEQDTESEWRDVLNLALECAKQKRRAFEGGRIDDDGHAVLAADRQRDAGEGSDA